MPVIGLLQPFLESLSLAEFAPTAAAETLTKFGISAEGEIGQAILNQANELLSREPIEGALMRFSSNQIIATLRELGISNKISLGFAASRTNLLSAIRNYRQQPLSRDYFTSLKGDVIPNPNRFAPSNTDFTGNYSYRVKIVGKHPFTGENSERFITVTSNDLLTKNQVLGVAQGYFEQDPTSYEIVPTNFVAGAALYNTYRASTP